MTRDKFNPWPWPDGATYGGRLPDNPPPSQTPSAPAAYKPQEYNPGLHKTHYNKNGLPITGVAQPAPQTIDELIARLRAQFPHLSTAELRRMAEIILAGGSVPAPGKAAPSPGPGQQRPAAGEGVPFGPAVTVQPINQELVTGRAGPQPQTESDWPTDDEARAYYQSLLNSGGARPLQVRQSDAEFLASIKTRMMKDRGADKRARDAFYAPPTGGQTSGPPAGDPYEIVGAYTHMGFKNPGMHRAQAEQALEDKRRQLEAMQLDSQIRRLEEVMRNQAVAPAPSYDPWAGAQRAPGQPLNRGGRSIGPTKYIGRDGQPLYAH